MPRQSDAVSVRQRVVLFAKYPREGLAKTRLIPALGASGAAQWQRTAIELVLAQLDQWQQVSGGDVQIWFTGCTESEMREMFGEHRSYAEQPSGDLGQRLIHATQRTFKESIDKLVIIGTDAPRLDTAVLTQAFKALEKSDVAISPATDGGYTLIGLRAPHTSLFEQIDWSTERVCEQTLERANQAALSVSPLVTLHDVDYPDDLIHCRGGSNQWAQVIGSSVAGRLSIIIPALNEAAHLQETLDSTLVEQSLRDRVEVIVSDGGSQDDTVAIAKRHGARTIVSRPGRARQMNAGASIATGEWLLFLHGDSRLPSDYFSEVATAMQRGFIGGAFRFKLKDSTLLMRCVELGTNLRSRSWGRPYGDQGIFVRADLFFEMAGYRDWPLMEDYELVGRLRRRGKFALLKSAVTTSARRWKRRGLIRTTLLNQAIVAAYHLGASPETLARIYRGKRK